VRSPDVEADGLRRGLVVLLGVSDGGSVHAAVVGDEVLDGFDALLDLVEGDGVGGCVTHKNKKASLELSYTSTTRGFCLPALLLGHSRETKLFFFTF